MCGSYAHYTERPSSCQGVLKKCMFTEVKRFEMTLESMRRTFAGRLLQRLSSLGVSQSGLSLRMDLPRTTVSAWALGKNLPSDVTSVRLAKELGTSVSYLYGETDDPRPAPDWHAGSGPSSAQEAKLAEVAAKVASIQLDLQHCSTRRLTRRRSPWS